MTTDGSSPVANGRPKLHRYTSARFKNMDGLLALDWVRDLMEQSDTSSVITAGAMASGDARLPVDHMFTAFLRLGLVNDMLCLYSEQSQQYFTVVTLGTNVCGHPNIAHGGLTAAIVDETLGGLNYVLKREGVIASGPSFTVHLEVDYKKPIPAESTVVCTAKLISIEGRKAWVSAAVQDRPDGETFAQGKALFVIPKDTNPMKQHSGLEQAVFGAKTAEKA